MLGGVGLEVVISVTGGCYMFGFCCFVVCLFSKLDFDWWCSHVWFVLVALIVFCGF